MNTTKGESRDAVAGQVGRPVRPVAWWHKAENGNIRCWTSAHADALRLAGEIGFELAPLYDQAALDAAVAAERERCASKCRRPAGWLSDAQQQVVDEIRQAIESGA